MLLQSKFHIVRYDYDTKKNYSVKLIDDKRLVLDEIWQYAVDYLKQKDGSEKIKESKNVAEELKNLKEYVIDKKNFRSSFKSTLSVGHYIVRDADSHVYSLTIWRKSSVKSAGWIYGSVEKSLWKKIFDVDVIETVSINNQSQYKLSSSEIQQANEKCKQFTDSLKKSEILQKLIKISDENSKLSVSDIKKENPQLFACYPKNITNTQKKMFESTIIETHNGSKTKIEDYYSLKPLCFINKKMEYKELKESKNTELKNEVVAPSYELFTNDRKKLR